MLASFCFPRLFWVRFLSMVCFPAVPAVAPLSLPFGPNFSACWGLFGSLCSFSRVLFHVLWLRWLVAILLSQFPPAAVLAVPSCLSSPFRSGVFLSVLWTSSWVFRFLRLRLLFAFAAPPVVFHTAGSPLAVPRFSGCCLPCVSAGFLLLGFSPPASCFFLVTRAAFSLFVSIPPSVFCGVLRSGFSSFSTGSALLCCCGFCLSVFLTRSNLRFPSQRGLPLGRVRLTSASVFLVLIACLYRYPFSVCLHSVPLPCSHRGLS